MSDPETPVAMTDVLPDGHTPDDTDSFEAQGDIEEWFDRDELESFFGG